MHLFSRRPSSTALTWMAALIVAGSLGAAGTGAFAQENGPDEAATESDSGPQIYADSLTHLEEWGSYAVTVQNERMYFGSGNRLIVADVSEPSRPREISRLQLPYLVRDVHASGEYLYVANDAGGFRVIDVTDPVEPTEVASMQFEDRVDAVDVEDGRAYLAARSEGMRIVDVSDPTNPAELGHFETDDQAAGVAVDGETAHVAATYGGHRIVDVSDPANPEEIGFAIRGSYDQGYSWDVALADSFAFVANVEIGLRRVNVANPADAAPTVEMLQTVRYTNDNRYRHEVLSRPAAVEVFNQFAYVADMNDGLRIVDLSDPDTLRIVGTADTPDMALDVSVSGGYAYVADRYGGVRVMDVSDPFDPTEIGFWDEDQQAVQVARVDGKLYMGDRQNGLWTLDAADPASPQPIGFHHFPELRTFDVAADLALAGDGSGRLRVLDLAAGRDPASRTAGTSGPGSGEADVLATYELPVGATAIRLQRGPSGLRAYVAAGTEGIRVLDLSDPGAPREIGRYLPRRRVETPDGVELRYYPNPPSVWALTLEDDYLYASFDDGIHVLEVGGSSGASSGDPTLVGRFEHSERAMQTVLRDGRLYAAFDDGLRILDVRDPAAPEQIGFLDTPSYARDVVFGGERLYVADLTGGVLAVDVSDPAAPQRIARIGIERGRVVDLAYDGNGHLFAAATSRGLQVIEITDPDAPRLLSVN